MKKISLEDHFMFSEYHADGPVSFTKSVDPTFAKLMTERLPDLNLRVNAMDDAEIDVAVLSLTQPGIQAETNKESAILASRMMNDLLAERMLKYPGRFAGFAALPMQDPVAAGVELERAVRDLSFVGACINGFSNIGNADTAIYLDEEINLPFWKKASELDVPIYLHPRVTLPSQQRIYKGYPALMGSAWGFAHETATHSLRLIMSGLFDQFPNLNIIIGHMGEGIPPMLARIDHRLEFQPEVTRGRQKDKVGDYFRKNFSITTSGMCRTQSLINAMLELGSDRIMFSSDYPFETMDEASRWIDKCPISDLDREKICLKNAKRLLKLN